MRDANALFERIVGEATFIRYDKETPELRAIIRKQLREVDIDEALITLARGASESELLTEFRDLKAKVERMLDS